MAMSEESMFAPPPFDAAQALVQLKKQLRDLRLAERGATFEIKGQSVVELTLAGAAIQARLVKRPARTPEWTAHPIQNAADVRRFVETVRQHLARWTEE
jgi:hypothetical protein